VSEKKKSPPLPFPKDESCSLSEAEVLQHLAQTLNVTKTFQRFPSLTVDQLRQILLRCAERAGGGAKSGETLPTRKETPEFLIYADGASRGNPGDAAAGVVITDFHGRTISEIKRFLGTASNNVAEYQAVILGMNRALELGAKNIKICLDSELVVRQLRGEYRVLEPHLKALHRKAKEILNHFAQYSILHIRREENRRADQLANEAIDQKVKR